MISAVLQRDTITHFQPYTPMGLKCVGVLDKFSPSLHWLCQYTIIVERTPLRIMVHRNCESTRHLFSIRFLMAVRNNVLRDIPVSIHIPAPIQVIFILIGFLVQFAFVAIQIVTPFTDVLWFRSGLTVPNRTVSYIPPSIRSGSRSILSSASRTYPLYGTVRFILRAGYGVIRFGSINVRFGSQMFGRKSYKFMLAYILNE